VVHVANLQDREGVVLLLEPIKGVFARLQKVWVDSASTGKGREWISEPRPWEVEVVRHAPRPRGMWVWPGMEITEEMGAVCKRPKGFRHLPRRWVGERTCAWIGRYRRMSQEYEYLPSSSESMVQLTMLRLMVRRLAGATETARENAQRRRAA
jgi:putative transposase